MALHSRNSLKTLSFWRREIAGIHQTPYIYGGPSGAPYKQALHRNGNEVVICDLLSGRF